MTHASEIGRHAPTALQSDSDELARTLLSYEAHYQGRQVAVIRGSEVDDSFVVEWAVDDSRRTIVFPSRARAQHFVEESLMALEYIGCTVLDWWAPEHARAVPSLRTRAAARSNGSTADLAGTSTAGSS